jgi:hypothetical protein
VFHNFADLFHRWVGACEDFYYFVVASTVAVALLIKLYKWLKPNLHAPFGIERTAYYFRYDKSLHIYGLYDREPLISAPCRVQLTYDQSKFAQEWRREHEGEENSPHAVLAGPHDWSPIDKQLRLKAEYLDYAEVKALTEPRLGGSKQSESHQCLGPS